MNVGSVALIPMAARPYHVGHDKLIRLAAQECNDVIVFASESDRVRPGEVPVFGADMTVIWHQYIEPTLPSNVKVVYGGTPIRKVYEHLIDAEENGSEESYVIYSDSNDAATNWSEDKLEKYVPKLVANRQVTVRPVSRMSTVDISGTQMRQFLATNDKAAFIKHLPPDIDADAIWDMLRKNVQLEKPHKMFQVGKKRGTKKAPNKNEGVELLSHYVSYITRG